MYNSKLMLIIVINNLTFNFLDKTVLQILSICMRNAINR